MATWRIEQGGHCWHQGHQILRNLRWESVVQRPHEIFGVRIRELTQNNQFVLQEILPIRGLQQLDLHLLVGQKPALVRRESS